MGQLAQSGATATASTSARHVRHALQAAGFATVRVDAPHRLHYLRGVYADLRGVDAAATCRQHHTPGRVWILGAGLAGAFLHHALEERGIPNYVVDPGGGPGGASANTAAALQIRLPRRLDPPGLLRLRALTFAAARLRALTFAAARLRATDAASAGPTGWQRLGLLHLPLGHDARWLAALATALPETFNAVDRACASDIAGCALPAGGVHLPDNGGADLAALCRWLLRDATIVPALPPATTDLIICASPAAALAMAPHLPLLRLPGTVSWFPGGAALRVALSGDGYVLPQSGGRVAAGGTYERIACTAGAADRLNQARCVRFGIGVEGPALARFRATRWNTPSRLPWVGPWPSTRSPAGPPRWLCTGFGSAGLTFAPLAAELIASALCNEPPPVSRAEALLLAPPPGPDDAGPGT